MQNKIARNAGKIDRSRTLRLVLIALFVALIAVGAFIKIPLGIGFVPISLQCAMCVLCALLLGARDAFIAVAIYVFMGLIGIPIFTAGGGFAYVFQPTFGYLIGYLVALPVGGLIARGRRADSAPSFVRLLVGALCLLAILYTFGVLYMYLMLNFYIGTTLAMGRAWLTGCAVFLPTDISFSVIASVVAYKVIPRVFRPKITHEEYVRAPHENEE